MGIVHLQRRLREVGRIRLGQQVATDTGRKRPAKLDKFRLTSRDERVIAAAAAQYGGTVEPWDAPDGQQFQVVTETLEMPVVVPPGDMAFSQWMELWSAGGCQRRCDGVREFIADGPCVCDPDARECAITSRLNVMLPEVPGFGLWRLESHGYYAATELAGVVELCRQASEAGHMLPARLRLEQRQVKRVVGGKPQTMKFAVPVLDIDVHLSTLGALSAGGGMPVNALADPNPAGWSPVPVGELPEAPSQSVRDAVASVGDKPAGKPRANAAQPIPSTGLEPRTAAQASGQETPMTKAERWELWEQLDQAAQDRIRSWWQEAEALADVDDLDEVPEGAGIDRAIRYEAGRQGQDPEPDGPGGGSTRDGSGVPDIGDLGVGEPEPEGGGDALTNPDGPSTAAGVGAPPPDGELPMSEHQRKKIHAIAGDVWEGPEVRDGILRVCFAIGHPYDSRTQITEPVAGLLIDTLERLKAGTHELHLPASKNGRWVIRAVPKSRRSKAA